MGENIYVTYLWSLKTCYHTETDLIDYEKMVKLSVQSMKHNLINLNEVIIIKNRAGVYSYIEMFRSVMKEIRSLCESNHNVFCCDADVLCIKPVQIFSRSESHIFRMYWKTGIDSHPILSGYDIPYEFNAGVKYFPKNIPQDLWDYLFRVIDTVDESASWATDQALLNMMFFRQDTVKKNPTRFLDNSMNWCPYLKNIITESQAKILHLHGSRNKSVALNIMDEYCKMLNIR